MFFDLDEEEPRPGDTIIDFSTDPPTVWTVPEDARLLPAETQFFPVGGNDRFEGTLGAYLFQGEGEWAAKATTSDGRPAVVVDNGLMADFPPDEASDFGQTVRVFASEAALTEWIKARGWGDGTV